jgi:coenzyme F420-0:L-glutamate ligase / coenzyme F420-1:gamma-L-glutamate ligase
VTSRTALLIPVKSSARAKARLASVLDPEARRRLALDMLEDVLAAVRPILGQGVEAAYVVTSDGEAAGIARRWGAEVLAEEEQRSESHSVDRACEALVARGYGAVLTIPADVPAVQSEDLAAVLAEGTPGRGVVLVPSRDEQGTNALWRCPPLAIPARFGYGSFRNHQAEAEARSLTWAALRLPRLALDIDGPEDLETFVHLPGQSRAGRRLAQLAEAGRPVAPPGAQLAMVGLQGIPEVRPGDGLARLIIVAAARSGCDLQSGDVLVIAQKIVSKAEGRVVPLADVAPSGVAREFAESWGKDPRVVEVVLREAKRIVRMDRGLIIAETNHGFICANAGVDLSNVPGEDQVCLLPVDPDGSAMRLRKDLLDGCGAETAVIVSDTFGRPWREGLTNVAIGAAGLNPLVSYIGQKDPYGHTLRVTELAVADELAAAAGLLMGKLERIPVVLVRGYRFAVSDGHARSLVRSPERDLFR